MSIYAFSIEENSDQFGWRLFPGYFSPEECDQLLADHKDVPIWEGGVVSKASKENNDSGNGENASVVKEIRNVTVKTVSVESSPWVYDKLCGLIWGVNQAYKFDLVGFMECMQLLHYGDDIGGGHYDWHQDWGPAYLSTRKLTVVVQLTDPAEYEGCETEVSCNGIVPRGRGDVVVFPSFMPHRVTELTKGQRDALIVWVNGPPYK